jgi:succinate dehydrogenase/fumarate reductase flavoprotein subunit
VIRSAQARQETRGMQVRTDFPERDDPGWLQTVVLRDAAGGPEVELRPVELTRLRPAEPEHPAGITAAGTRP